MKKIALLSLFAIMALFSKAQNLECYFHHAAYNSPDGAYLETYMSTIGNSAVFAETEDGFQSEIEITMLFKQQDSIRKFQKYVLKSPVIKSLEDARPNFLDQQRISLDPGVYNFEVIIKDLNAEENAFTLRDIIMIDFPEKLLSFSGIQILENYYETKEESILSKNGFDLIPYVSNFFPGNVNVIRFYMEIYNADKVMGDDFLVRYFVKNHDNGKAVANIARFKRMEANAFVPVLGQLNIEDLHSGNYQLVIEVLDKNNKKIKEVAYFFQRSKPIKPLDMEAMEDFEMNLIFEGNMDHAETLANYIQSLRPIANEREKQFIDSKIKTSTVPIMQRFFYAFWYDRNTMDPGGDWKIYKQQVEMCNDIFGTSIKQGFETDRGRVYLAYGAPDDTFQSGHEPSAYPYEIWSYYRAGDENNRKFVFYNPALAGNDYELLHSNVTGELKTPNWERYLSRRNNDLYNQDVMTSDDQWGSRALEYYNSH